KQPIRSSYAQVCYNAFPLDLFEAVFIWCLRPYQRKLVEFGQTLIVLKLQNKPIGQHFFIANDDVVSYFTTLNPLGFAGKPSAGFDIVGKYFLFKLLYGFAFKKTLPTVQAELR